MFDLERQIALWRDRMLNAGIGTPVPLDELETHLRDEIEQQIRSGVEPLEAFNVATREVGQPVVLKSEFAKVSIPVVEHLKNFALTLAGIPHPQLATNMNTTIEPRWVTYLKTAAVMLPAMFFWMGACVFVVPKLKEIWNISGVRMPDWFMTTMAVSETVKNNILAGSLVFTVLLILLEWRSQRWARYRRLIFGVAGFALNLSVLLFIAGISVLAIIAADQLLSRPPVAH